MSADNSPDTPPPPFRYDRDIAAQVQRYLVQKNAHGLALIARQKGIPPFLRFKVWPILLKHHPFVANPFLEPDDKDKPVEADVQQRVRKDLRRYMHRIAFSSAEEPLLRTELELFDVVEGAVVRFVAKWGRIVAYDPALTWLALGLAEWMPPLPHTPWVLLGRDVSSSSHTCIGLVFADYDAYLAADPPLRQFAEAMLTDDSIGALSFAEVYERLVLVLLHSPRAGARRKTADRTKLPTTGGTIDQRVLLFIHVLQRVLPELAQLFADEQLLSRFGRNDDEWLIWWLKYCGAKVWARTDRGRVWDLMLGWRLQRADTDYAHKLCMDPAVLQKLGPDAFWTTGYDDQDVPLLGSSPALNSSGLPFDSDNFPFAHIDPHIELLFVSVALLKAKENTLVELDQHEIRTFLSRLPAKKRALSDKYKQYQEQKDKDKGAAPAEYEPTYDYMDSIIYEAGELWRKWLWMDMSDE